MLSHVDEGERGRECCICLLLNERKEYRCHLSLLLLFHMSHRSCRVHREREAEERGSVHLCSCCCSPIITNFSFFLFLFFSFYLSLTEDDDGM